MLEVLFVVFASLTLANSIISGYLYWRLKREMSSVDMSLKNVDSNFSRLSRHVIGFDPPNETIPLNIVTPWAEYVIKDGVKHMVIRAGDDTVSFVRVNN